MTSPVRAETQKPYGRVFYTRGKLLIFYAYDLDQQTTTKTVNAFQAWGRLGPDQQKALNLGVFYEDNASEKRWILKCDDPKRLAQVDGVLVTVEPDGGTQKPSREQNVVPENGKLLSRMPTTCLVTLSQNDQVPVSLNPTNG